MNYQKILADNQSEKVIKYCPYCGSSHFECHDSKSFECKTCGKKLYINAAAATIGIICNHKNELLVTVRKKDPLKGYYDLPGGFVDLHETAEQGVIREIKEELNIDVTTLSYFASDINQYYYKGLVYHTLDLAFICHIKDFSPLQAADDVAAAEWINIQAIDITQFAFPSTQRIIQRFTANRQ